MLFPGVIPPSLHHPLGHSVSQFISSWDWLKPPSCRNHFDICPPLSAVVTGQWTPDRGQQQKTGLAQFWGQFFSLAPQTFFKCMPFPEPGSRRLHFGALASAICNSELMT